MKKNFKNFLITFVFLTIGIFTLTNQAHAETEVSGNITSDATWTLANSPYIVTSTVQVLEGVNLIIESGVTVNFNQSTALVIGGKLVAIGAENQKITFHGGTITFTDKSIGAVTDQNNNYISGSIIKNAIIESGKAIGLNIDSNPFISNNVFRNYTPNTAGLYVINLHNSSAVIINNLIDNNSGTAINVYFSGAKIINNTITNNLTAFEISGGTSEISKNTIKNNYSGFFLQFGANPKIQYNNIFENGGSRGDNIRMAQNTDIKADYNYLGATEKSLIDASMSDYYDNIGLGKIIYEPYALSVLKFDGTDTFSQPDTCTSWTYSDWTSCSNNNQQTRTVTSSSPNGCVGGSPVLTQSCVYVPTTCTSWAYSNWGTCTNGQQTRTILSSSPVNCSNGNPILNQSCTTQPTDCTSWTYSNWSSCQSNGTKTRSVVSSSPNSCSNGNPVLTQSCTYIAPVCTSWAYSNWGTCSNGQQTRSIISSLPEGCAGGISNITRSCTVDTPNNENQQEQTCSSFTYSNWSNCSKDNIQSRSALSGLPNNCSGGQPILSQMCIYVADQVSASQTDINKTNNEEKSAEISVVVAEVINREQSLVVKKDTQLTNRLKGKILLQVESRGEAWYVSPSDGKKIYMANGNEAYQIMRNESIGISNKDLEKIKANKNLATKHSGKIFLQVEARGEAYYIDFNGVAHYLKDGAAAYEVMRSLGLGISNKDIRKVEVSI